MSCIASISSKHFTLIRNTIFNSVVIALYVSNVQIYISSEFHGDMEPKSKLTSKENVKLKQIVDSNLTLNIILILDLNLDSHVDLSPDESVDRNLKVHLDLHKN